MTQSIRSKLVARRTYCRPKKDGTYETWAEVCARVTDHQKWLWERAKGSALSAPEEEELQDFYYLMLHRKAMPSGRVLWMGGTEQSRKTEIAMFNCCFLEVRDVYSAVDAYYLLLNGCGVGFKPVMGLLNGFARKVAVEVIRSQNQRSKGTAYNSEKYFTEDDGKKVWHLQIGDSGRAWSKAFGKLLAMKKPVDKIILNFTRIRKPGVILSGYGWLSSGDEQIAKAFELICAILNSSAGKILDELDTMDIINLVGTTLTSRRSAEMCMMDRTNPLLEDFIYAKKDHFDKAPWRSQSNNSVVFYQQPSKLSLRGIFASMLEGGGSEPGLYNGAAAKSRGPWFSGTNPCGEILLADGGLCNLAEFNVSAFPVYSMDDEGKAFDAIRLLARANYRQTCVNLKDGVLSDRWHETQDFLRLCGVGLTGVVDFEDTNPEFCHSEFYSELAEEARDAANMMADELNMPRPKAVTTIKPSGTLGKLMDCSEGLHRAPGRYLFNWIKFDRMDPTVLQLKEAGYKVQPDPYSSNNVIIAIPVDNGPGKWNIVGGKEVNSESAFVQLERYRVMMEHYVDHNASVSISYSPDEVPGIVDWLHENWDTYVGVSFILRQDHSKTAGDLGYPYLPQEVVSKDTYERYVAQLCEIDFEGGDMLDMGECEGGTCPVR